MKDEKAKVIRLYPLQGSYQMRKNFEDRKKQKFYQTHKKQKQTQAEQKSIEDKMGEQAYIAKVMQESK